MLILDISVLLIVFLIQGFYTYVPIGNSSVLRYHAIHKEVYDWFNISFDKFGRTSSPEQTEACQSIFKKIFDNKWLSERTVEQVFSCLFVSLIEVYLFYWLLLASFLSPI